MRRAPVHHDFRTSRLGRHANPVAAAVSRRPPTLASKMVRRTSTADCSHDWNPSRAAPAVARLRTTHPRANLRKARWARARSKTLAGWSAGGHTLEGTKGTAEGCPSKRSDQAWQQEGAAGSQRRRSCTLRTAHGRTPHDSNQAILERRQDWVLTYSFPSIAVRRVQDPPHRQRAQDGPRRDRDPRRPGAPGPRGQRPRPQGRASSPPDLCCPRGRCQVSRARPTVSRVRQGADAVDFAGVARRRL